MIVVIPGKDVFTYRDLIFGSSPVIEAFRHRKIVFKDRYNWAVSTNLSTKGDLELDEHDGKWATYVLSRRGDILGGSARVLPMDEMTLMERSFQDTSPGFSVQYNTDFLESSKLCPNPDLNPREGMLEIGAVLVGVARYALTKKKKGIIGNFDDRMHKAYSLLQIPVEIVGTTDRYKDPVHLGVFSISPAIVNATKERMENLARRWQIPPVLW